MALLCLVASLSSGLAHAQAAARAAPAAEGPRAASLVADAPLAPPPAEPSSGLSLASTSVEPPGPLAAPPRSARLLAEGGAAVGAGLVLPLAAYAGFTALQSFVGFFAGFLSGTVLGAVVGPLAVVLTGRALGASGGTGRAVVGALLGLLAGLLIGLPLATVPGAGYLVGLGLLWALPAVGTLVAFESGREAAPPPQGAVVLRF
ncbi:MAG: hypothetical protein INH41_15145 [Myxococcaceae bacterium]|nr:hypothetical protein [Myxococcaceae bacterium]